MSTCAGIWICCVCTSAVQGFLNLNDARSTTRECSSCSHIRCSSCEGITSEYFHGIDELDDTGGFTRTPPQSTAAENLSSLTSNARINLPTTPEQPQLDTTGYEPLASSMNLDQNEFEFERETADQPLGLQRWLSNSSTGSSSSEHRATLSGHNTQGATEVHATAVTGDVVRTANINNSAADDDDHRSAASSTDQFYSGFSTLLGANLTQDLQDVELDEHLLETRLEEFSLRSGNENPCESHLRLMDTVYRNSRYE